MLYKSIFALALLATAVSAQTASWLVKDRSLSTPPGSPAQGDRYIVGPSPTGAWAGHANDIALRSGSTWKFITAQAGLSAWVEDEPAKIIYYNGSSWGDVPTSVSVNPVIPVTLVGNGAPGIVGSFVSNGTTSSLTGPSFQGVFGLTSNKGAGAGPLGNNVAFYSGVSTENGSGNTWGANLLNRLVPGLGSGNQTYQIAELDLENDAMDFGTGEVIGARASIGLAITASTQLGLNGGLAYKNNAALWVTGREDSWNYGVVFSGDSIVQATILDAGDSTWGIRISGDKTWGIDFAGTISSAAVRCKDNMPCIGAENAAANATLGLLKLNASDVLVLGEGVSSILFGNAAGGNNFHTASPAGVTANRWYAQGALTTITPILGTEGTDTNVSGLMQMQGTGSLLVKNVNGNYLQAGDGFIDLLKAGSVLKVAGTQVVGPRNTGWAADTGTAKKTANATYSGTAEVGYTQATIQALMDAVRDATQTQKSIKDALISHGMIGP